MTHESCAAIRIDSTLKFPETIFKYSPSSKNDKQRIAPEKNWYFSIYFLFQRFSASKAIMKCQKSLNYFLARINFKDYSFFYQRDFGNQKRKVSFRSPPSPRLHICADYGWMSMVTIVRRLWNGYGWCGFASNHESVLNWKKVFLENRILNNFSCKRWRRRQRRQRQKYQQHERIHQRLASHSIA